MKRYQAALLPSSIILVIALLLGCLGEAMAGFDPSPFKPAINRLGAVENQLVAVKGRVIKTMDEAPGSEGPSSKLKASLNRLDAIDKKLAKVDDKVTSVIEEVMGFDPTPFETLDDVILAIASVDRAAVAILEEIDARLGFEPTPFLPEFEDRLRDVRATAQTVSSNAQGYTAQLTCSQGATDGVFGTYTRAGCIECQPGDELTFVGHRLLTAREAMGALPQTGFMYLWNDAGTWFALDFADSYNTCVRVYDEGRARIAGVVQSGNGPQVGRAFGFHLEDQPGPAYFNDRTTTVRFTSAYGSEDARQYMHYWCETGELPGAELTGYAVWPGIVIDGSFVICNSPSDGD